MLSYGMMMSLLLNVASLLCTFRCIRGTQKICCPQLGCYTDGPPFDGLPLPQCPDDQGINMQVYTRQNPADGEGQIITRNSIPAVYDGSRLTIYIVHGWTQNENMTWMHVMKNAFLTKGDYNVIIVGWSIGAGNLIYNQSFSDTRSVGGEIGLVCNRTIKHKGSSRARQYCVGHSLGSHVCGHAGQQGQFGRITGLDPGGPTYKDLDRTTGLNPSCADYVDVIHSSILAGAIRPAGHVDFYPNGGQVQPGCNTTVIDMRDMMIDGNIDIGLILLNLEHVLCDHMRAVLLYTESILTPCFPSHYNCTDGQILPLSCKYNAEAVQSLGFNSNTYSARGILYLPTNCDSPFCRG